MSDHDIAVLVTAKNEIFRTKIFSNISKGRGSIILEEEQIIKPVSLRESEEITTTFFSRVRRAWEQGELVLTGRDDDIVL